MLSRGRREAVNVCGKHGVPKGVALKLDLSSPLPWVAHAARFEGQQEMQNVAERLWAVFRALGAQPSGRILPEQGINHVKPSSYRASQMLCEDALGIISRIEGQRSHAEIPGVRRK